MSKYYYVAAVRSFTGEYKEYFTDSTWKEIVVSTWKEIVVRDKKLTVYSKTKGTWSPHTYVVNSCQGKDAGVLYFLKY